MEYEACGIHYQGPGFPPSSIRWERSSNHPELRYIGPVKENKPLTSG